MKILLSGAGGFVGRQAAMELAAAGHQVLTTDRSGAVDLPGDLSDEQFCRGLPDVDAVVHGAAVQYVSADLPLGARRAYFQRNNVEATRLLCRRYAGAPTHFIYIGTSMMYAQDGSMLYTVRSPMAGQGIYSRSKLAALRFVRQLPNPHATVLPCIIGGPGREGLFRPFVAMAKRGAVAYPGEGRNPISMVHVADVASLIRHVVASRAKGLFNAAAADALCIEQWIDLIQAQLGMRRVRRLRIPLAPVRGLSWLTGYRLLAREQLLMLARPHVLAIEESLALGWRPLYDSARIVRDTADFLHKPSHHPVDPGVRRQNT